MTDYDITESYLKNVKTKVELKEEVEKLKDSITKMEKELSKYKDENEDLKKEFLEKENDRLKEFVFKKSFPLDNSHPLIATVYGVPGV